MNVPDELPALHGADPRPVAKTLAVLLASSAYLVPLLLARSSSPTPDHPRTLLWYRLLRKPSYKPPDLAIPIAWTLIESGLAVAAYRLLRRPPGSSRNRALVWLGVCIAGIGGWSRLFFGRRSLPASTVGSAALLGAGAAFVGQARKTDKTSALAGVPLIGWVAFATVLTADIWRRNR